MACDTYVLKAPQLGVNEDTATLYWEVEDLAHVSSGDQVLVLESMKATVAIETERSGFLLQLADHGTEVCVGQPLALVGNDLDRLRNEAADYVKPDTARIEDVESNVEILVTDKAKVLARKLEVDLAEVSAGSVVRERDVLEHHRKRMGATGVDDVAVVPNGVVIHGCGNGARTMKECLDLVGDYQVVCFVDYIGSGVVVHCNLPVLVEEDLAKLAGRGIRHLALVTTESAKRVEAYLRWRDAFEMINVIHPTAYVSPSAQLGEGNYIKAGAVVETRTRIGNACFVDNGAILAHDNEVEDGCHIAPGVALGSSIRVGRGTIVGIGASISTGVTIGEYAIIGVGAGVVDDVEPATVVAGCPAKVVGKRNR